MFESRRIVKSVAAPRPRNLRLVKLFALTALAMGGLPLTASAADAILNLSTKRQVIDGFGASSAWCGAINDNVMNALYGDLGYSILRLRIEENIGDNWKTGNFNSWAPELSNAKKASAKGAIVFASPWNPPKSMQENFTKTGDASAQRLRVDKYSEYVDYLNAYVKYMKDNGVNLHAVSVQNEPDYAQDWNWWTPNEMLSFMKTHAGQINSKVMAPESFQFLKNISDPILNDATALANMDILGLHLYGTPVNQFAYPLYQQKSAGKKIWMTEHYYDNDDMSNIMKFAKELHDCMVTGNMNAYVYWWITWPNGLANSNGTIFKRAYVLGQFAKHIRPGYVRTDGNATPSANVYVSSYTGANKVVVVAVNNGNSAVSQKFNIQGGIVSQLSSWNTTTSTNMAAGASYNTSNDTFTASLPAQSITTFVGNLVPMAVHPRTTFAGGSSRFTATYQQGRIVVTPTETVTEYAVKVRMLDGRSVSTHSSNRGSLEIPVDQKGVYLLELSSAGIIDHAVVQGY